MLPGRGGAGWGGLPLRPPPHLLWLPLGAEQLEGEVCHFAFRVFKPEDKKRKNETTQKAAGAHFGGSLGLTCFARWAPSALTIYLFFKSLPHESVGWLGGKTQATIKEIADERHAVDAVPAHHS